MTPYKKIVLEELGLPARDVSVSRGAGTAGSWIYIRTPEGLKIPRETRTRIEARLVNGKHAGQYYSDYGPCNDWIPCVSWGTR